MCAPLDVLSRTHRSWAVVGIVSVPDRTRVSAVCCVLTEPMEPALSSSSSVAVEAASLMASAASRDQVMPGNLAGSHRKNLPYSVPPVAVVLTTLAGRMSGIGHSVQTSFLSLVETSLSRSSPAIRLG